MQRAREDHLQLGANAVRWVVGMLCGAFASDDLAQCGSIQIATADRRPLRRDNQSLT